MSLLTVAIMGLLPLLTVMVVAVDTDLAVAHIIIITLHYIYICTNQSVYNCELRCLQL